MKKVLVIDDELSIANFITDVIQMLGFDVKVLTSGKGALSTAKEWKPDLITLDLMMPSPDGIEVLAQLQADPETCNIPVFVVSIIAKNSDVFDKLSHAKAIFQKPIDTREFINQIRKVQEVA